MVVLGKGIFLNAGARAPLSYTVTNLAPTINGNSGWSTGTSSSTHVKYADSALRITGSTSYVEVTSPTSSSYPFNASHTYYGRVEVYHTTSVNVSSQIYFPIAEPFLAIGYDIRPNEWQVVSGIMPKGSHNTSATSAQIRLDYNNDYNSGYMWFDGLVIVDLTACFGSGNEPTKEWCDANIPFFTGTTTVNVQQSVNRRVKNSYIGVSGVARKVKNGYIGVSGVARKFFGNNYSFGTYFEDGGGIITPTVQINSNSLVIQAVNNDTTTSGQTNKYNAMHLQISGVKTGDVLKFDYNYKHSVNTSYIHTIINVGSATILYSKQSSNITDSNFTVTVTLDADYVGFIFQAIGGSAAGYNYTSTITITNLYINGEKIV